MKVYLVLSPAEHFNGTVKELFSRETAIDLARRAAQLLHWGVREYGDMRTDDEALDDFVVVHWAEELEVL